MSSKAGGSIGAFLVSLPVSAILLMMVFGVPRFAPGTNGENGWDSAKQFFSRMRGDSPPPADDMFRDYPPGSSRATSEDPFAPGPHGNPGEGEAPRWNGGGSSPHSDQRADVGEWRSAENDGGSAWPFGGASSENRAGPGPARDDHHHQPSTDRRADGAPGFQSSGGAFTWSEARRRLAELGIQQFHLEPGLERDQYLFVCLFTPGDDARVTHRFEAEAADPLTAVQKVLTQVDDWLSQRHAERSRQIIQPRETR